MKYMLTGVVAFTLAACGQSAAPDAANQDAAAPQAMETPADAKLAAVLAAQPDKTKARYQYRHPKETLEFFGVEPGMTVVDVLPGEPGWYAPILLSYLGPEGRLYGADYNVDMWRLFGGFADADFLEARKSWPETYVSAAKALGAPDAAALGAFTLGTFPDELDGKVDVVLMFRAAHHLNRFEDKGGYFTSALAEIYGALKPGGVLGVVQHRAPEDNADAWANGDNGYLKQSQLSDFVEQAGFELVDTSEVNANPNDRPTEDEFVWRLPPTLATSGDDPDLRAQMQAIGESDRMTLKFRKPE